MANKKMSTAELVGISHFSRNGLMTQRYGEVVYFIVQPTNISVLSETSIAIKINHLMQLLSQQPDIEIICSDARENFEYNKLSLARKAEKEDNLKVQLLLRRDMKFLDDIQLQMSTARELRSGRTTPMTWMTMPPKHSARRLASPSTSPTSKTSSESTRISMTLRSMHSKSF